MGIELDVLVGHPEHRLLFIGAQVTSAAGLDNASGSLGNFRKSKACTLRLSIGELSLPYINRVGEIPKAPNGKAYHAVTALLDEAICVTEYRLTVTFWAEPKTLTLRGTDR